MKTFEEWYHTFTAFWFNEDGSCPVPPDEVAREAWTSCAAGYDAMIDGMTLVNGNLEHRLRIATERADFAGGRIRELEAQLMASENREGELKDRLIAARDELAKERAESRRIVRQLLDDTDESACTCGADDWPNGKVDVCYLHEAMEFVDRARQRQKERV